MKIILFLNCFALALTTYAQQSTIDLEGEWSTVNVDSAYYKNNDIELHQDINYYVKSKDCYYVYWRVLNSTDLQVENHFVCTEPGRVTRSQGKETFKIIKDGGTQKIEILRDGRVIDKFKVIDYKEVKIDRYPFDTKILKVRRIKI